MQGHAEGSYLELLWVRGCRLFFTSFLGQAWAWGARADNEDFGFVTVLQGGVPKAITDLA